MRRDRSERSRLVGEVRDHGTAPSEGDRLAERCARQGSSSAGELSMNSTVYWIVFTGFLSGYLRIVNAGAGATPDPGPAASSANCTRP